MGLLKYAGSGVRSVYDELTLYWKHPAKGNFVSYREVLNLGVGGMGQQLVTLLGYNGIGGDQYAAGVHARSGARPLADHGHCADSGDKLPPPAFCGRE